jgi:Carboxypeptidase regulatory-like domain
MIAGIVRDETGAPIEHVRVYFTHAPVAIPDVAALTGPDGKFALAAPVHGSYVFECTADGFAPIRRTVVVPRDDEVLEINLGRPSQ